MDAIPSLIEEMSRLLPAVERSDLLPQLDSLRLRGFCTCGDSFCSSIYTSVNRPAYSEDLEPADGMLNIDIDDDERICGIEILYRDDYNAVVAPLRARRHNPKRQPEAAT